MVWEVGVFGVLFVNRLTVDRLFIFAGLVVYIGVQTLILETIRARICARSGRPWFDRRVPSCSIARSCWILSA